MMLTWVDLEVHIKEHMLSVRLGYLLALDASTRHVMFNVTLIVQSRWRDVSDDQRSILSDGAKQFRSNQ